MSTILGRWWWLVGVAALALAGALVAGTVLAQSPTPEAKKPIPPIFQTFVSKLAQKLGKSEAEVQTAIGQAQQDLVNEGAQQGRIPPAAADRLRQRLQQGPLPFSPLPHPGPRGRGPKAAHLGGPLGQSLQVVADFFGLTREQVIAELRSGKSLAEIAQAKGKTRDDLKATILAQAERQAKDAVAAGRVPQDRADAMLNRLKANIDRLIDARPGAFKPGHGGDFKQKPQATPAPTS